LSVHPNSTIGGIAVRQARVKSLGASSNTGKVVSVIMIDLLHVTALPHSSVMVKVTVRPLLASQDVIGSELPS